MNNLNNIKIYNSKGDLINNKIDDNNKTIYINLDKVSVDLIQSQTIYILEKVHDGSDVVLSKPKFFSDTSLTLIDNNFSVFSVDHNTKEIKKQDTNELLSQYFDDTAETYTDGYRDESSPLPLPLVINIMFSSSTDGYYEANMILLNSEYKIVFSLYCESEGSDDRLINLLKRFDENISYNEEIIFKESDISDDLQSHILLNQKRKDLLNNIYRLPQLTSISGLEFIIDFFGYSDIMTIKEFYYDDKNEKIVSFYYDDLISDRTKFSKMSNFGLFYQLNKPTDEVDEFDNPITVDTFTIPINEIIIKFFALRKYIESRSIGGVSRIIDIVGEKTKFSSYIIQFWTTLSHLTFVDKQVYPEVEKLNFTDYIIDLRNKNIGVCEYDPDDDLSNEQIGINSNCYVGYFANYYQDSIELNDEPNIEIGAVLSVRNTTFDISWTNADISWDTDSESVEVTWLNIGGLSYHTTKFEFIGNNFKKEILLLNSIGDSVEVILPYIGNYDMTVTLIGYNNLISKRTFHNYIDVKMKEVEFMQFFRFHERDLQFFETCYLSWEDLHVDWNSVIYNNSEFVIDDGEINFGTYELINYILYDTKGGFGELNWLEYRDESWENLEYLSWEDIIYKTKKLAYSIIDNFRHNDTIQIHDINLDIPSTINISNYTGLANHFNSLTDEYVFTHKIDFVNNDFIEVLSTKVGISENYFIGTNGDTEIEAKYNLDNWSKFSMHQFGSWNDMIVSWNNTKKLYRTDSYDEAFTLDNIRFYKNEMVCPKFIPIFFTVDDSSIVGKTNATFEIYDEIGNMIDSLDGLNICKRFDETGLYTIVCKITDTNGNTQTLHKNNIIKITEHNGYRNMQ